MNKPKIKFITPSLNKDGFYRNGQRVKDIQDCDFAVVTNTKKVTYEEYLQSLIPPFKCVYDNHEYIVTAKDTEWTLTPCRKSTNNGEAIKVPLDTVLTHIIFYSPA